MAGGGSSSGSSAGGSSSGSSNGDASTGGSVLSSTSGTAGVGEQDGGSTAGGEPSAGGGHAGGSAGNGGGQNTAAGAPPFVDPFMGTSGCPDGGFAIGRAPCQLSMPLSGGLPTLVKQPDNVGCGHLDLSNLSFSPVGAQHETWLHFAKPLVRGATDEPLAASVEIRVKAANGDWQVWSTPADACTITLASNVCWYFEIPDAYYLVSGTGNCSKPAEPEAASGSPVQIDDFWFVTLLYP
jgi:hypothetical protein